MTTAGFERAMTAVRGNRLSIEEDLCINLRGRDILCRRCERACPGDVLILSADDVAVSDADCTGCGACVPACPTGVFRLPVFDPERFLGSLDGCGEVHLHCSESRDPGGGVVIPCHLMLDARLVAAAFAEGMTRLVMHGVSRCEECPRGDAGPHIGRLRRALGRWFGEHAPEVSLAPAGAPGGGRHDARHDQVSTDRRGFLKVAGLRAAAGAAWLVPGVDEDEEDDAFPSPWRVAGLPKRPVRWRLALWRRLDRLPWAESRALPWHVRSFDETCSGCMVCAERCPTGAVQGVTTDTARSIEFEPSLCTNCTLCQQICPQDSVRPRLARSVAEASASRGVLMHMVQRPCPQCGAPIVAAPQNATLCGACANEQEMDEAWLALLDG